MRLAFGFSLLLVLACPAMSDDGPADPEYLIAETEALLESIREEFGLPGLALAIADDREILEVAAVGSKRFGMAGDIEPHSRFHLGSVSKPISSTAIGVLVEHDVIGWDTTIFEVFPEWQRSARPDYASITLRQLLTHTAGIRPFEDDDEFLEAPVSEGTDRDQRRVFAEWLLTLEPVAPAGTTHVYSNAGYTIAAAMVEQLLDEDFEDLVQQYVFEPLGMTSAGTGAPFANGFDEPWGHVKSETGWVPVGPPESERINSLILPAGNFSMSLPDLARFGMAHLDGLNGADNIVESATYLTLHTAVMDNYALGWNVGDRYDFHLGGLEGMHTALLLIMKKENRVYALATNAEIDDTEAFGRTISALKKR